MDAKLLGSLPASPLPMVSTVDNNIRSAFDEIHQDFHGLTKRELFAAMAMQGLGSSMRSESSYSTLDAKNGTPEKYAGWIARAAVRHADALLAELAKES